MPIWCGISSTFLFSRAIPFLLRDQVAVLRTRPPWFWFVLSLAFFPTFMTLIQGQDSILLLLVFVLTFVFLKKNADFLAGSCLALGLFRFHVVLPLALILLLKSRRNAVLGLFPLVWSCSFAVSAGLVGWNTVVHYPQYVLRLEAGGAGGAIVPAKMPTLHGLLDPIIGTYAGKTTSDVMTALFSCALLLIAVLHWPGRNEKTDFDLQFSLTMVITVLVSYHAYAHDLSLLLLPLLLVANRTLQTTLPSSQRKLALLGPMFLLFLSPLYVVLWFRYGHLNLLGVALLWWAWGLRQEIRQPSETVSHSDYVEHPDTSKKRQLALLLAVFFAGSIWSTSSGFSFLINKPTP